MRRAALLACAAALAAAGVACGEEEEREAQRLPDRDADRVTVVVRPEGSRGPQRRRVLDCAGADARDCERLRQADLSPTPPEVACTQIYGGPATARITGRLGGRAVDVRFSRESGCEIGRWDRLSWLLGDPPAPGPGG